MSVAPAGPTGTIKRTGRDGYACAHAIRETAGSAAAPAARCRNCRRGSFILNLPSRHSITSSPQAHHCAGGRTLSVEVGPRIHEPSALLEHVAALVGGFGLVVEDMGECCLDELAREVGALGRPGLERRTEAARRQIAAAHALEDLEQCHVGEALPCLGTWE